MFTPIHMIISVEYTRKKKVRLLVACLLKQAAHKTFTNFPICFDIATVLRPQTLILDYVNHADKSSDLWKPYHISVHHGFHKSLRT